MRELGAEDEDPSETRMLRKLVVPVDVEVDNVQEAKQLKGFQSPLQATAARDDVTAGLQVGVHLFAFWVCHRRVCIEQAQRCGLLFL